MTLTQINKAGLDELALDHVFPIGASGSSAYWKAKLIADKPA